MKLRNFFSVVPQGVRTSVKILIPCAALAGIVFGFLEPMIDHRPSDPIHELLIIGAGLGSGILFSCLMASWILCLGFVYGDARQRGMRPILWTLIAAFVPHLLGFLLYFAMRQPISTACGKCGQSNSANMPFCSWCGSPRSQSPAGGPPRDLAPQG